jgi:hypothetical protein
VLLCILLFSVTRDCFKQAARESVPDQGRDQLGKRPVQGRVGRMCLFGCDAGEHIVQRLDLGVAGLARRSIRQPSEFGTDHATGAPVQGTKTAVANKRSQLISQAAPGLDEMNVLFRTPWAALTRHHVWVEKQLLPLSS